MSDAAEGFGATLRLARQGKHSQETLAEALNVRQPAVSAWESGRTVPELPTLIALCEVLDLDVAEMATLAATQQQTAAANKAAKAARLAKSAARRRKIDTIAGKAS